MRPEHRDLLDAAAADSTDDAVVVRAGAKVVAAVEVNRPDALEEIAPLHIWTAESVRADRLDFRPKHRLTVLVVQASPLVEPVRLARTPDYAGCTSWVQVPLRCPTGPHPCTTTRRCVTSPSGCADQSVDGGRGPAGSTSRDDPAVAVVHGVGGRHKPSTGDGWFVGAQIAREPRMRPAGDEDTDPGSGGEPVRDRVELDADCAGIAGAVGRDEAARNPSVTLTDRPWRPPG